MELPERDEVLQWIGRSVLDVDGEPVGSCLHVYADDATGASEWLVVQLDDRTAFVPLTDARSVEGGVRVPFARTAIASSPRMSDTGRLTSEQDVVLYEHYGVPYSREASPTVLPTAGPVDESGTPGVDGPDDPVPLPVDAPTVVEPVAAGPTDLTTPSDLTVPVAVPLAEVEPVVVAPADPVEPVVPEAVEPTPVVVTLPPTTPAPSSPPPSRGADLEPVLLGGLAVAAAVLAVVQALRGRRRESTAEQVRRQARERGAQLARTSVSTGKDLAAAGGELARAVAAGRHELADVAELSRRELAKAAAAAQSDLASRRKQAAKAATAAQVELASRRTQAVQAAAAAQGDLTARRKQAAKAAAARRKRLSKRAGASRSLGRDLVGGLSSTATTAARSTSGAVTGTAARTAHDVAEIGGTLLSVPVSVGSGVQDATGRRVRSVRRSARRTSRRLTLALGLVSGYVAGAHAGRERYEEIVRLASSQVSALKDRKRPSAR